MASRTTPKRKRQPAAVEKPISRYPVPALEDLPADLQARIVEVQAKTGFIPNVFSSWRTAPMNSAPFSPTTTPSCCATAACPRPSAR